MSQSALKEITIRVPSELAEAISGREIIETIRDKFLTKSVYYESKCNEFREKYGMSFGAFKKKTEKSNVECFEEWDDLLLWEGFELALKEWKNKYNGIKKCMASSTH